MPGQLGQNWALVGDENSRGLTGVVPNDVLSNKADNVTDYVPLPLGSESDVCCFHDQAS